MKLLTLVAPGGDEARRTVSGALAEWTRGLDIRLRFLNIGVEEAVVVLAGDALGVAEAALLRERPAAALLHGRGPLAMAAAISVSKAGVPLVRTGAGRRDGEFSDGERAADRLGTALLAEAAADLAALAAEGLAGEPFSPGAAVKAVIRINREA